MSNITYSTELTKLGQTKFSQMGEEGGLIQVFHTFLLRRHIDMISFPWH